MGSCVSAIRLKSRRVPGYDGEDEKVGCQMDQGSQESTESVPVRTNSCDLTLSGSGFRVESVSDEHSRICLIKMRLGVKRVRHFTPISLDTGLE